MMMTTKTMPRLGRGAHGLVASLTVLFSATAALAQEPMARSAVEAPALSLACPGMAQLLGEELAAPAARVGERAVLTVDLQLDRAA